MKPVDTLAATSLSLLEADDKRMNDAKYRSAWSMFLVALSMRMPEDIEILSRIIDDDWKTDFPEMEILYAKKRQPSDPLTLQEFIDQKDPDHISRWTPETLHKLIDHEALGQQLNSLRWFVLRPRRQLPSINDVGPSFDCSTSRRGCHSTFSLRSRSPIRGGE